MKIHHPTRTLITTVATSLLIAGIFQTADARDREGRDGSRRHESRTEQRSEKRQSSSRKSIKHHDRKETPRSVAKKRHVTKEVVRHQNGKPHRNDYHPRPAAKRVVHHDGIRRLPSGYHVFSSGKDRYYYKKGIYYRRHNHGYVRVHHPRLHRLPRHARRVVIDWVDYWVCDDIFYVYRDGCYEICERPSCISSTFEFGVGPVRFLVTDHDGCCY